MLTVHRIVGTWQKRVDVFIAHTEFARCKFIEGGLPADRIVVKPQMVSADPGAGEGRGNYALFVGRLSEEKGVRTLATSWQKLPEIPLLVAGDGPLSATSWPNGVIRLGNQSREQVNELMRNARVLIVPSVCYEIGPLTVVEAFACGLPVIASDMGSMAERVSDRRTGLLFRPGDAEDLALQVRWAWEHPEELRAMRAAARSEYEQKYTAERNYKILMKIYDRAIESARDSRAVA
jgi:glycosyltransferase involved in cell wall biosynthesis